MMTSIDQIVQDYPELLPDGPAPPHRRDVRPRLQRRPQLLGHTGSQLLVYR